MKSGIFFYKYDINGLIGSTGVTGATGVTGTTGATGTISSTEKIQQESFKIYPTITKDFIQLKSEFDFEKTYEILSMDGKTVKIGKIENTQQKIYVSELSPNSYLIKIGNATQKFIVSK